MIKISFDQNCNKLHPGFHEFLLRNVYIYYCWNNSFFFHTIALCLHTWVLWRYFVGSILYIFIRTSAANYLPRLNSARLFFHYILSTPKLIFICIRVPPFNFTCFIFHWWKCKRTFVKITNKSFQYYPTSIVEDRKIKVHKCIKM